MDARVGDLLTAHAETCSPQNIRSSSAAAASCVRSSRAEATDAGSETDAAAVAAAAAKRDASSATRMAEDTTAGDTYADRGILSKGGTFAAASLNKSWNTGGGAMARETTSGTRTPSNGSSTAEATACLD
eukprot:TRINITY_DN9920_c0_g1_i1.p2 TRINITY_DN9920_c0_g1~~TRINITY_DN9920_c0_g1_i1.p2  ORF type:complete len:130 (+),score=10.69 TRINITY_DN9920_c0_g1_i1:83-472(+)